MCIFRRGEIRRLQRNGFENRERLRTTVYPETYVIDRKGKIARKIIGEQRWDSPEMSAYFDALLAEK